MEFIIKTVVTGTVVPILKRYPKTSLCVGVGIATFAGYAVYRYRVGIEAIVKGATEEVGSVVDIGLYQRGGEPDSTLHKLGETLAKEGPKSKNSALRATKALLHKRTEIIPVEERIPRAQGAPSPMTVESFKRYQSVYEDFVAKMMDPHKPVTFIGSAPLPILALLGFETRGFTRIRVKKGVSDDSPEDVEFGDSKRECFPEMIKSTISDIENVSGDGIVLLVTTKGEKPTNGQIKEVAESVGAGTLVHITSTMDTRKKKSEDREKVMDELCQTVVFEVAHELINLPSRPTTCAVIIIGPQAMAFAVGRGLANVSVAKTPKRLMVEEYLGRSEHYIHGVVKPKE